LLIFPMQSTLLGIVAQIVTSVYCRLAREASTLDMTKQVRDHTNQTPIPSTKSGADSINEFVVISLSAWTLGIYRSLRTIESEL
jgi:hypothetical protein